MQGRGEFDLAICYSPTSRATCQWCNRTVNKGTMRMMYKKRSDYHDGFDTKWNHAMCQLKRNLRLNSIQKYVFLKYSDCIQIRGHFNFDGVTETDAEAKRYIKESEDLWKIIDSFEDDAKPADLKALMKANGLNENADLYEQLFWVGFGLYRGLYPPCPSCNNHTLVKYRDKVICQGWLSGFAPCPYQGKEEDFKERYRFNVPTGIKSKSISEFQHPDKKYEVTFKPQIGGAGAAIAAELSTSGVSIVGESGEKITYKLPGKNEECSGMVFQFVGNFEIDGKEIAPTSLQSLVEKHGGKVGTGDDVTHVVVSDVEAKKKTKNKLVNAAIKNQVPVVSFKYLIDLLGISFNTTTSTTTVATASAVTVKSEPAAPAKRGRKRVGAAEEAPAAPAPPPPAEPEKPKRGRKAKAASESTTTTSAVIAANTTTTTTTSLETNPDPKLRLPGALKDGGYLLYKTEEGEVQLEKMELKETKAGGSKRKYEEVNTALARKPRPPPLPGSEILKVHPEAGKPMGKIYIGDDNFAFNCTMNNVDLTTGKNRFYILQLIETKSQYFLFKKWGRTGDSQFSGTKTETFKSKDRAIREFAKKYNECTGNVWGEEFRKIPGRYFLVELDSGHDSDPTPDAKKLKVDDKSVTPSQLDTRLQKLIQLLFDKDLMVNTMKSMNIDVKKMPLGKLSKDMIMEGYRVLRQLEELMEGDQSDPLTAAKVLDFSTRFYSMIPHSFPNGVIPPLINNKMLLQEKVSMLESLLDMEIASKLMGTEQLPSKDGMFKHPIDLHYESLRTKLTPLDKDSEIYKTLVEYTANSHIKDQYYTNFTVEVTDIFVIDRDVETQRFESFKNDPNRQLLWHGSRLSNWVGILSQGLRIAPPEAPVSGYLFGKGVYFANCVSKSGVYCRADKSNPTALMMLSEVCLGKPFEVTKPTYMEKPKPGCLCTYALGKMTPDPKANKDLFEKGPIVPMGKMTNRPTQTTMGHDEFIVYDVNQIKTRYLLEVKFVYE